MDADLSRSHSVVSVRDSVHNTADDDTNNHDVLIGSRPPSPSPVPIHVDSPKPPSNAKPPSSTKPPSASAKPLSTKPKSAKAKARSPSPSPPPAPPPQPLRTVRLDIQLGGPDNYEVDIVSLSKATGQRAPTPEATKRDTSDSESDDDKPKEGVKPRKRKKKNTAAEYYDVNDPFIDDSELAIDQRTFFAQTKQQGFYVSSGEVALLKDKSPRKPKSKKLAVPLGLDPPGSIHPRASAKKAGTRDSPIPLDSDGEGQRPPLSTYKNANDPHATPSTHVKSKTDPSDSPRAPYEQPAERKMNYISVVENNNKKKKIPDITCFHPDLQASVQALKEVIAKESWEVKGKFPPSIKPFLATIAMQAIRLGEYDEHFFNLMPALFPYNKFTMSVSVGVLDSCAHADSHLNEQKLIKRTVFPEHTKLLVSRQDELLLELKEIADNGFTKAQEEWEKNVMLWDKRQEKAKLEAGGASTNAGDPSEENSRHATEEAGTPDAMDVDAPQQAQDGSASAAGAPKESHPPAKRFRLTEPMKVIIWQLVLLSNEVCRLENEKNNLEGSAIQVSEQGLRKVLYQKIVSAYPSGWMSSGQISREVSAMKKRFEREALENE
ncbi:hypothetical protein HGRIS_002454 [Hohenbuehelia grisea]|uniref:Ubinuclein middle domain-containing protein n=1 Tax=Hohenbuehelia grisea TaxID=104357 RepID=A0ABR3JLR1_9AGAR